MNLASGEAERTVMKIEWVDVGIVLILFVILRTPYMVRVLRGGRW